MRLVVGGTVFIVGGTVLTFGIVDALAISFEAAEGFEAADLATHAAFVLAPGITLGGAGIAAVVYGIYSLVSSPKACS